MEKETIDNKLSKILDLSVLTEADGEEVDESTAVVQAKAQEIVTYTPAAENPDEDITSDYQQIRKGLYNLIEKGGELVDNANFYAEEEQSPRAVEAAAIATKEQRDNLMALMDLHKKRKDIDRIVYPDSGSKDGGTNINNSAVFVGTTGELLKLTQQLRDSSNDMQKALDSVEVPVEYIETEAENES